MSEFNLNEVPNEAYKKFFDKFKDIDTISVDQWNVNHLIGYFCRCYKNEYNIDYKFKFNSTAPSKSFEVFQMKKLAQLLSSDPNILKSYIDFVFEVKVKSAKRRLTSISFLLYENLILDYKKRYLSGKLSTIDRTTSLPDNLKNIFGKYSISTYGDLAFLYKSDIEKELFSSLTKEEINIIENIV